MENSLRFTMRSSALVIAPSVIFPSSKKIKMPARSLLQLPVALLATLILFASPAAAQDSPLPAAAGNKRWRKSIAVAMKWTP
jgi:hypothetical protein